MMLGVSLYHVKTEMIAFGPVIWLFWLTEKVVKETRTANVLCFVDGYGNEVEENDIIQGSLNRFRNSLIHQFCVCWF